MTEKGSKARQYTGQLVTSETYNKFTKDQRNFWNKAYKSFRQGKFYFKHNGQEFIVPFRLVDGSFNSVMQKEIFEEKFGKEKIEQQNIKEETHDISRSSATPDTLGIGSV